MAKEYETIKVLEGIEHQYCHNCEELVTEKFLLNIGLRYSCNCGYVHSEVFEKKNLRSDAAIVNYGQSHD